MNKKKMIEDLLKQKQTLTSIIRGAEKRLKNAPEGQVRVAKHRNGYQFYLREKTSDIVGKYLPASERKLAIGLVHKRSMIPGSFGQLKSRLR